MSLRVVCVSLSILAGLCSHRSKADEPIRLVVTVASDRGLQSDRPLRYASRDAERMRAAGPQGDDVH